MTRTTQLFLLHFAGGNCYSYEFLRPYLKEFDVGVIELPGRGKRMDQALLNDFDGAASDIYRQISQRRNGSPFLLYGHSMGAYLTLRVAAMFEQSGTFPEHLIVSGNPGPGVEDAEHKKPRYLMEQQEMIEELKVLGGVPAEFLENVELFECFEPILRADFEIAERNELAGEPAVQTPIYALMGSEEKKAASIANWGRFTKSRFLSEILAGGHFFIHKHPQRIAAVFKECLAVPASKVYL